MLVKSPVLEHYDPSQEFTDITDASLTGLGAVLAQGKYIYLFFLEWSRAEILSDWSRRSLRSICFWAALSVSFGTSV